MFRLLLRAFVITLGLTGPAMAQERVVISSGWGKVTAELVNNNVDPGAGPDVAAHDRNARSPPSGKDRQSAFALAVLERQLDFSTGTLGLWSSNHFVIYYRDGRVPQPG